MTNKKEPRIVEAAVEIKLSLAEAVAMLLRQQNMEGELADLLRRALIDSIKMKEDCDG